MDKKRIKSLLTEIGLTTEDISLFNNDIETLQYIRFHHKKYYDSSSILFIGFSEDETKIMSKEAKENLLNVNLRISENLNFICAAENADKKRIEKGKGYGAVVLSKGEFEIIFNKSDYSLYDNENIYNKSISEDFRIAKPLSNFNAIVEVESFNYDSEIVYNLNLTEMKCSCVDFEKNRVRYAIGDLRRLCKHLLSEYKNSFGLRGLTELKKSMFENGYPVNEFNKNIDLEKFKIPVVVNYQPGNEWWNIYVPNSKGEYKRYGYSSIEERFSYDEKPHGIVSELRPKLNELRGKTTTVKTIGPKSQNNKKSGCASVLVILCLTILIILFIFLKFDKFSPLAQASCLCP